VLVTGGASGLGRAVARAVAQAGGLPFVLDRVKPAFPVDYLRVDLADGRATEAVVRRVAEMGGGLDAVVTAAGIDSCGRLSEVAADAWEKVVSVNLLGTVAVVRAALPFLERRAGKVVTVASTLGLRPLAGASAYTASKFGVVGFTRALALEEAGRVGVTLLIPGGMRTNFFEGRSAQFRPNPETQLNPPEAVAAAVLFALRQPAGCEIRELVLTPSVEASWP
jgi:NAD(P)-dependent dehydrogenase (short-subunit alcohol dehydrogenase family)